MAQEAIFAKYFGNSLILHPAPDSRSNVLESWAPFFLALAMDIGLRSKNEQKDRRRNNGGNIIEFA